MYFSDTDMKLFLTWIEFQPLSIPIKALSLIQRPLSVFDPLTVRQTLSKWLLKGLEKKVSFPEPGQLLSLLWFSPAWRYFKDLTCGRAVNKTKWLHSQNLASLSRVWAIVRKRPWRTDMLSVVTHNCQVFPALFQAFSSMTAEALASVKVKSIKWALL